MIHYFGYGSNMSAVSLASKGVEPIDAVPGVLAGWRLTFNIRHPFAFEGHVANVTADANDTTHGVIYTFKDGDLASLDRYEGKGYYYERQLLEVQDYGRKTFSAYVYIGTLAMTSSEGAPSGRYRNILANGARAAGVNNEYIEWLEKLPAAPTPSYAPFKPPANIYQRFTRRQLRENPALTALSNYVFDMSSAGPSHLPLRPIFGGRDVTGFMLKLMDSSLGDEESYAFDDDALNNEQRQYLNIYLHEFSNEYRYVGRLYT